MIHSRKLNRKQIKFLIKMLLVLNIPEETWCLWGEGENYNKVNTFRQDLTDNIVKLLQSGSYSNEKQITDITFKHSLMKFMMSKTTALWDSYKDTTLDKSQSWGYSTTKGTWLYKYPLDIMDEIRNEVKKEL